VRGTAAAARAICNGVARLEEFAVKPIVVLLFASLAAVSCTTAQLDLPQSLAASADVVPAHRSTWTRAAEPMSIGGYTVTQFHDAKKTHVASSSLTPAYVPDLPGQPLAREATTKQTIRFTLDDGGAPRWNVVCQTRSDANDLESRGGNIELPGHFRGETVCAIDALGSDATTPTAWTLNLSQYRPGIARTSITGELTDGATTYDLMPVYRLRTANGRPSMAAPYPLGFTMMRGDDAVAAIDTVGQGRNPARIHFGTQLTAPERSLLAAASAAVLLQQEDRGGVTIGR
jgi:hypothetical protein